MVNQSEYCIIAIMPEEEKIDYIKNFVENLILHKISIKNMQHEIEILKQYMRSDEDKQKVKEMENRVQIKNLRVEMIERSIKAFDHYVKIIIEGRTKKCSWKMISCQAGVSIRQCQRIYKKAINMISSQFRDFDSRGEVYHE